MANDLYTLHSGEADAFVITKYDSLGLEQLSQYVMPDAITCSCPAAHRESCRHRDMLPLMLDRIDSHWFYDFDNGQWMRLVNGQMQAEPIRGSMPRPVIEEGTEGDIAQEPLALIATKSGTREMTPTQRQFFDGDNGMDLVLEEDGIEGEDENDGDIPGTGDEPEETAIEEGINAHPELTRDEVIDKLQSSAEPTFKRRF